MPEGRYEGTEDSAGRTVDPLGSWALRSLEFELEHGAIGTNLPRVATPRCVYGHEPFGPELPEDQAERVLLGSVRIFQASRR
jgi:hypothetical protein